MSWHLPSAASSQYRLGDTAYAVDGVACVIRVLVTTPATLPAMTNVELMLFMIFYENNEEAWQTYRSATYNILHFHVPLSHSNWIMGHTLHSTSSLCSIHRTVLNTCLLESGGDHKSLTKVSYLKAWVGFISWHESSRSLTPCIVCIFLNGLRDLSSNFININSFGWTCFVYINHTIFKCIKICTSYVFSSKKEQTSSLLFWNVQANLGFVERGLYYISNNNIFQERSCV